MLIQGRVFAAVVSAVHSRWLFKELIAAVKRCYKERLVKVDNPSGVIPLAIEEVLNGFQI